MRRLAAVLTFVVFTLGLVALPTTALAQTTSPTTSQGGGPNPLVSGPFTGTDTLISTPACSISPSFIDLVSDGTYLPTPIQSGRTGTFHVDGCLTPLIGPESPYSFSGTFTLTAPNGATMNGTAAGTVYQGTGKFSYALTPTGGTMQFTTVGGVVNLTGQAFNGPGGIIAVGVPFPISGSLAGALTR